MGRLVRPGQELEGFRMRVNAVAEAYMKAGGKRTVVDKLSEIIEEGGRPVITTGRVRHPSDPNRDDTSLDRFRLR